VLERPVAPAAIVVGETGIRGAEIGGCYGDGSTRQAPLTTLAHDLEASSTRQSLVEERRAQCRRLGPIS